ncbi:DNA polymerase III subunit delta' [Alphaproteobacteria bacterium]|nr:DNA polymerase III subunit delta' [Alphaproteobacteria bacterium]
MKADFPLQTNELLGHEAAWRLLAEAHARGELTGSWLLAGPAGIGKATLAYMAAKKLLAGGDWSVASEAVDRPGKSNKINMIRQRTNPNLYILERDFTKEEKKRIAASIEAGQPPATENAKRNESISVDDINNIINKLSLKTPDGTPRVVVIDSGDDLNLNSANTLLKTLEEPPADTVIFMLTAASRALLPTIRSRCRLVRMAPLGDDIVYNYLKLQGKSDDEAALLAKLSHGSIGRALLLDRKEGVKLYSEIQYLATQKRYAGIAELTKKPDSDGIMPIIIADIMADRAANGDLSMANLWEKYLKKYEKSSTYHLECGRLNALMLMEMAS